jgi:hypothetical protein
MEMKSLNNVKFGLQATECILFSVGCPRLSRIRRHSGPFHFIDMGGFKRKKVRAVDPNCQDRKKVEAYKAKFSPKNFNLAPKAGFRSDAHSHASDVHLLIHTPFCTSHLFADDSDVEDFIPHNSKVARQMMAIAEAKQSRLQKREKLAAKKRKSTGGADGLDGLDDSSGLPDGMHFSRLCIISKRMQNFMLFLMSSFQTRTTCVGSGPATKKKKVAGDASAEKVCSTSLLLARNPPRTS